MGKQLLLLRFVIAAAFVLGFFALLGLFAGECFCCCSYCRCFGMMGIAVVLAITIVVVAVIFAGVVKIINPLNLDGIKVVIVPGSIVIDIAISIDIATVVTIVVAIDTTAIDRGFVDQRNSFVSVFVLVRNSKR